MKYFILAGEASGDLHSAALAGAMKEVDTGAVICGWGGDEMSAAGVKILKHYRELAFMGFVEVLQHLPEILRNFRLVKSQILDFKPDALILTDYPGFNLRIAQWAHKRGIPVHYYISPQLWAWKENRVKRIRRYVDQMYVILPFEQAFYARHGIRVHYVGHPLAWRIGNLPARDHGGDLNLNSRRIVLLPGSRHREIRYMLPVMLEAVKELKGYRIDVAGAPSVPAQYYYTFFRSAGIKNVSLNFGYTYGLLGRAQAALCTSGTATLETALFNVPQVVCYKGDRLSYLLARRLIRVPFIAIVNLICEKEVVKELIQDYCNPVTLASELNAILEPAARQRLLDEYAILRRKLDGGNPGLQVAEHIVSTLKHKTHVPVEKR